ncbi:winged helix DNA-binding domain-containing protein [Streptomyces sp. NPDC021020]|uniref:winged helix DNA-binding domain-containing protein n=1 Tax=Streptomyces sp. NPDC021020 TaxID=3365109 RepID=UPI0037962270
MSEPDQRRIRELRARAQAVGGGVREGSPADVVRRVLAVQAQDAVAAALGIRARGRGITAEAVRAAYEDERSIFRGWFVRGTLHTVPAADARWLLRLLAPGILAATTRRYRQLGLGDKVLAASDELLGRTAAAQGPLTRPELTQALAPLGIPPEGQAPFHLIRHAALTGVLCHGPQRAGEATYVPLDDWLPPTAGPEGDDAVAELARRYLAAYAPAAPEDFATWSGLPLPRARRAWQALAAEGTTTPYDAALTTLAAHPPEPPTPDTPDVRLLPAYDGYLLGHRTRATSVPAPHQSRVWPGGGIIRPTALADGLTLATWTRTSAKPFINVEPFAALPPAIAEAVARESAAVTAFLRPET